MGRWGTVLERRQPAMRGAQRACFACCMRMRLVDTWEASGLPARLLHMHDLSSSLHAANIREWCLLGCRYRALDKLRTFLIEHAPKKPAASSQ